MPLCFEQSFTVYQFECDPWDRMTPGAVLRRVQEISTAQCEALNINEELYRRTQTIFLLSKLSLEVYRVPRIEEKIRMETRAYGMRRAVFHRVTSLHAENGDKLCETDSRWVLVNTQTRHILRKIPEEYGDIFADAKLSPGAEEHAMEMPKPAALAPCGDYTASYTLCDRNGHINNTRYADIVCDHLPLAHFASGAIKKMLLFYRAEIPMGQSFHLENTPLKNENNYKNCYYFLASHENIKNFECFVGF